MAKISTTHLKFNGRSRKVEVHYSTKDSEFFVKLPEVEALLGKRATGETEEKALRAARDLIATYEKKAATRRKVIIVYNPTEDKFGRFRYNNLSLDCFTLQYAFAVVEEIEIDGERQFVNDDGRSQGFGLDDFAVIPWTAEREAYFEKAKQTLERAKASLREFLEHCEQKPALLDKAIADGALLLEAGK